jgi:NAD(P)H-flavin reductase
MLASPEAASAGLPAGTDPMLPVPFLVKHVTRETGDTFTLTLSPTEGATAPRFAPGQFNMLYVFGVGEAPISISGDPSRPETVVHTIRAVGAVTRALQRLGKGDQVGIRGPFGTSWPVEQAHGHDVVIVAGGIGLAPLRPALYYVLAHRAMYGRVALLYGARTPRDILYPKELSVWRGRFDMDVDVTVDRASVDWQGSVGVVTRLIERAPFDPDGTMAFICGPEVMIRFSAMGLERRGVPLESIVVSMERNMKCAVGLCGHCQFGPLFVCRDGPVFPYHRIQPFFGLREV